MVINKIQFSHLLNALFETLFKNIPYRFILTSHHPLTLLVLISGSEYRNKASNFLRFMNKFKIIITYDQPKISLTLEKKPSQSL